MNAGIKTRITSHSAKVGIRNWVLSVGGHRDEHESEEEDKDDGEGGLEI
jgi:hypothetical protein